MKKAVIYARVSTKRQADDGLPVESQLDHCRAKAAALGLTVVREFVDGGISGTTDKRPAFQDALNYCATVDVEYLPECLVRLTGRTRVRSAANWLPVLGTPRTMRVTVVRPPSFKLLSCGSQWARAA